jgi:hypothetical protein
MYSNQPFREDSVEWDVALPVDKMFSFKHLHNRT